MALGTLWEHFGNTLGTLWEHFGNTSCRNCVEPAWYSGLHDKKGYRSPGTKKPM
jgi:hypothetical protein